MSFHAAHALFGLGGHQLDGFTKDGVFTAAEAIAVGICGARVLTRREDRLAWAFVTFGLLMWASGDLVWTIWLENMANPPSPSIADGLYVAMYPALYIGVMRLIRSRLRHAGVAQWLDGAIVGLTVAAIAASLVFSSVLALNKGHLLADAVNMAYPLGDLTLLIFVLVAFSLSGWRPGRLWLFLGGGICVSAVANLVYVYQSAKGTYVTGTILDSLWPAYMMVFAVAAWQPAKRQAARQVAAPFTIVLPLISAGVALALLVDAAFRRITPLAVALAAGALVVISLRTVLTFLENVRMLRRSAHDAVTDGLSGLGNRRRLMQDLEEVVNQAGREHPYTLAFFDLNGFKRYNDTFGHAAGDALLTRIGVALLAAVASHGEAYRLGGDEFCVLLEGRFARHDPLLARAGSALSERGKGFTVSASFGVAVIPDDATNASAALQLADERMYADKASSHGIGRKQTRDVLLQLLNEITPDLHKHASGVSDLVVGIGRRFSMDSDQMDEMLRAAELHDIGKLAIPEEILHKPGALTGDEWRFVRQHPIIGERILNAAPALRPVGRLVRASHERWDGTGYPDGLAGEEIPLGARIIAACDAYHAMTSDRCYRVACTRDEALAELSRSAGSQFDPAVIDAIDAQLAGGPPAETDNGEGLGVDLTPAVAASNGGSRPASRRLWRSSPTERVNDEREPGIANTAEIVDS